MKIAYCIPVNRKSYDRKPECSSFLVEEYDCLKGIYPGLKRFDVDHLSRRVVVILLIKLIKFKIWNYSIIHINYGSVSGLTLALCSRIISPRSKIVLYLGGSDVFGHKNISFYHRFLNSIIRYSTFFGTLIADVTIVVHEKLANHLEIKNYFVIPRGVNMSFFCPKIPDNNLVEQRINYKIFFSMPRKNSWVKNLPLAKEIVKILNEKAGYEKYNLNIVSGKSRIELYKELIESDIVLLTSFHEGSPNIIKEAMSCNLPIVSSNVGDVGELFQFGKNLKLLENLDPMSFITKIDEVINDLGPSNGREILLRNDLDQSSSIKKIVNIYEQF